MSNPIEFNFEVSPDIEFTMTTSRTGPGHLPHNIIHKPERRDQPTTTGGKISGRDPVGTMHVSSNGANTDAWARTT